MRHAALVALALAAAAAAPVVQAQPRPPGGGVVVAPGGAWVGGGHRPWYGPRYGYGYGYYGRWGWGYPAVGFGYGYGAGWALAATAPWSPWYWGAPAVAYAAPAIYPYGYVAPALPTFQLETDVSYVQQAPQPGAPAAQPPAAAPQPGAQAGYWYYCTEPAGYHPYVSQCARPWIAVNPKSVAPAAPAP